LMLGWFAYGCWSGFWTLVLSSELLRFVPGAVIGRLMAEYFFFLLVGGYLTTGAPGLVRWVFGIRR
jgi:hypothetical protein